MLLLSRCVLFCKRLCHFQLHSGIPIRLSEKKSLEGLKISRHCVGVVYFFIYCIINFNLYCMKIKWGALVVDGRGKLGGHVAAQNRGGSYLRTKVTPSNPQSTYQTTVRNLFGSISSGWSGLSPAVLDAWNAAVEDWKQTNIFGDLKQPSGKALYQRLNQQAQIAGYPAVTAPPPKQTLPDSNVTAVSFGITATEIDPTGIYSGTDFTVLTFSSGPVTAGTSYVKNQMRLIGNSGALAYSATDAFAQYVAKFGTPTAGEKVFMGYKIVADNGQSSPMQIVETVVVA